MSSFSAEALLGLSLSQIQKHMRWLQLVLVVPLCAEVSQC